VDPAQVELQARLAWLEGQLEQARIDTHVPGMAIAIVRGDEIIYAHGFGVADRETDKPVTPETTFAIGSSTKAFSSALVAMMIDEGKMDWDDPITKFLPKFVLDIDTQNEEAPTVRDLLSHRAGFARMGLLWAADRISREQVFEYAAKAKPVAPFRDEFHYNNVTYMAGAISAAKVAGTSWEELLQTRLLEPLQMTHTHFDYASAQSDPNMAKGYTWRDDMEAFEAAPMRKIDVIGPAGSINSTVLDMANWLRLHLGRGEFEGERIVSKNSLMDTRRSVITVAPGAVDYGMGWMLREWEDKKVVEHGGNIDGFAASVALLPEEDLGVVLLTNASMTALQQTGFTMVWDALLTDAYTTDPNPSGEDLRAFVGKYVPEIPGFEGELFEVMVKGGKLAVDVPGQMIYSLAPPDDDDWRYFDATDEVAVSFEQDTQGQVTTLLMHQGSMSFELLREGLQRPVEVLEDEVTQLLGYYESEKGIGGEILVRKGRLAFDIHKQMAFDLEAPEADGEYHFRANYDMFLIFDREKAKKKKTRKQTPEKVVGLTLFQDGEAIKFERKKGKKKVSLEKLHKLRRTDKLHKAFEAAGVVRLDQKIEVLSSGIVGESQTWFDARGELRQSMRYGELGEALAVFHEGAGWSESSFEPRRKLEGALLEQLRLAGPNVIFGDWRPHYPSEEFVRTEMRDDREVWVVKIRAEELPPTTLYIDAKTRDIVEVRGFELAPNGLRVPVTSKLSDYRNVEGMRLPFRVEVTNSQTGTVVATTTGVETQLSPDPERFVGMPSD
jgi:CubicO group peptidase (beta-lactamase class C family)